MGDEPDVMRALGRIEGRLDGIEKGLTSIKDAASVTRVEHAATIKAHDERLSKLERSKAWLMGAAAACGAGAGYLMKYMTGGTPH